MILFLSGLFIGALFGVGIMAVLSAGKGSDDER